jgi:hypothetical protein
VMMQCLSALRACVIDFEVLPKQRASAALGTALRKAAPHGKRQVTARPVGDYYRHHE